MECSKLAYKRMKEISTARGLGIESEVFNSYEIIVDLFFST
jgi:hypothetical protein